MYWEKALKYFQQNAYEAGGDPFVLRDMALTHKYLAGLAGMDHKQRIGHATEAVRLDRMDLAYSINAVAAQPGYLEGFLIRKGLAISDPNNAFVLRSLLYPIRFYGVVPARLQDWLRVVRG